MATKINKRLFLSCIYLGILFLGAGAAFYSLQSFSGTIFLLPGAGESLVFRPAEDGLRLGVSQRGVARDLLLFDNPRSVEALRADQNYDGLILPFALRLDKVEVVKENAPRQLLYIEGPGEARQEALAPGTQVTLGDTVLDVASLGPWEGLVRDPQGEPMAMIDVPGATGDAGRPVFLGSGQISIVRPDLAVCFLWHDSEADARKAFVPSLEAVAGARWGVREGAAIQWFENFIPGTGAVLRDGTRVTLESAARTEGFITLQVERSAGRELKRVAANDSNAASPFIYEDPAGTGRVLYLHAWREDSALGRLLARGEGPREIEMAIGSSGAPVVLRQIMAQALAAPGGKIHAAHVRIGDRELDLREGLAETAGDYRLRYQVEPVPPDARYHITALDGKGAAVEAGALEAAGSMRCGAWVFTLAGENPFAPRGVALTAVRRPGGLAQTAGLALFVLGSFGLAIARFAPRR